MARRPPHAHPACPCGGPPLPHRPPCGTVARPTFALLLAMTSAAVPASVPAGALRDTDPTVRSLADNALWAIWFRADTPENNEILEQVRTLIGRQQIDQAIALATRLIGRAPRFAEAYNQRAIAHYIQGHF